MFSTHSSVMATTLATSFHSFPFLLRLWDLDKQEKQLLQYQQSSTSLDQWIDNARKRQDSLQMVKINDIQALMEHLNQQKACLSIYTNLPLSVLTLEWNWF